MKVHDVIQGSTAWLRIRMGKPTASQFSRIVTPTGKVSTAQDGYMRELLAELIMGRPLDGPKMPWMERGTALEPDAVALYEFKNDVETEVVGFITNDAETMGCSPDRRVTPKRLLQVKCPKPEIHVGYLLFDDISKEYRPQLQGELYVAEAEVNEIISYHPEMPYAIVKVERDEPYIKLLAGELDRFVERLAEKREELGKRGLLARPQADRDHSADFLTDSDLNLILEAQRV
ncbi:MAG: YqaJ viral recombinase family protein [Acidobacteriota bacterium]|nr:YqaJ viral recombinase family protein [Acidobacteriota bacterium]